ARLTFAGTISAGANPLTFGGADNIIVNGVISGSGPVSKQDTGTLTLNAANSFSGPLSVTNGTLSFSAVDAVPTNPQPLGALDGVISLGNSTPATLTYTGAAGALNRGITLGGVSGATIRDTGVKLTLGTTGATSGING